MAITTYIVFMIHTTRCALKLKFNQMSGIKFELSFE